MGKIIVGMFVSVDGIIEDPMWTFPFWHDDIGTYKETELMDRADALLLGRKTYESFAAAWPDHPEHGTYKDKMNAMPKHVATTTLEGLEWNAARIEGDVAEAVAKLKADRNLLIFGSKTLVEYLREHKLIDEYRLVIYPVLLGKGDRLFNDADVEATLELAESKVLDNGVMLATYTVDRHEVTRPSFDG